MKIIVKINKMEDMEKCNSADAFLLANKDFSYRYDESFSLSKIKKAVSIAHKHNKEIYILVNKIFFEEELLSLTDFLISLKEINVDRIYFSDFAVFTIASELFMQDKLVFYHDTFLRNSLDILTYQELGIDRIVCSKDMNLQDIKKLPVDKKEQYGIICFGYMPLYTSKRQILKNYAKTYNLKVKYEDNKCLYLKEATRNELYRVLEQNKIASIFNCKILSYVNHINELKENINEFIIDSLFFNIDFINQVIEIIRDDKDNKNERIKNLDSSLEYSEGFLCDKVGLI